MVLAITNTSAQAICDFSFQVVDLPCVEAAPDLALSKSVNPASVPVGQNAVFTLNVTNNGPGAATNVVVTDTLPSGLAYVSNTCGATFAAPTLTWNVGGLADGAGAACDVTVTVTGEGTLTNNAVVTADGVDPVPANNSASASVRGLTGIPTLSKAGTLALVALLAVAALWVFRARG